MNDEQLSKIQYQSGDITRDVDLVNKNNSDRAIKAMKNWSEKALYG